MRSRLHPRTIVLAAAASCAAFAFTAAPGADPAAEWPMWGGSPERNMVSPARGMPTSWDLKTGQNVKWTAELGSQTYGNPVVADGIVLVGTNNELERDPRQKGDRGVLKAFRASDGEFLWQATHEKIAAGRVNDWPYQGVCSSPLVEDGVVYYVSNRGEVVALDIHGFRDGVNNGPYKDEKFTGETDADIIWKFDMMEEVGSFPHNMSNSSPVSYGNLLFVSTSNGVDESHVHVPSPRAPSMIALDKKSGELVWEVNHVGERILHGQWSTPTVAKIGDTVQVMMGEGDGWVRSYEATTGEKLWEFDTNPKDSVWPKTRNEIIATPVVVDGVVYIANGQDPEHGEGTGHLYAIDPTKRGDITESGRIWYYDRIRRSISTAAVHDGILYYADFSGFLHALDAKTGKPFWVHDMFAAVWGSAIVIGDKVYLGDEDGDVTVLQAGRDLQVLHEMNMGSSIYSTPVPAGDMLFVSSRNRLFALRDGIQGGGTGE
jgi:outer membrane protein assembly factor BamB